MIDMICIVKCCLAIELLHMLQSFVDSCLLPFDVGLCQDNQQRWYFDKSVGYCKIFMYGGCDGNQNRFFSEDECMHYW